LTAFESPYASDMDHESKENHMAHVAWNALMVLYALQHKPHLDDRYKVNEHSAELAEGYSQKDDDDNCPEWEKAMAEGNTEPAYKLVITKGGTYVVTNSGVYTLERAIERGIIKESKDDL
jgi:hypothetical protein